MKKTLKTLFSFFAVVSLLFVLGTEAMAAKKSKTLKNTQKKGFVRCGVSQGLPGFSNADASGNWTGVDVDVCRAVAAAVLGDAGKVKFTPLSAKERFTALTSGEIDILSRNTTWTLSRDADIGLTSLELTSTMAKVSWLEKIQELHPLANSKVVSQLVQTLELQLS